MAVDEVIKQVVQYAAELGLHGVVILSPTCDACGHFHDFRLISDLSAEDTVGVVGHFASLINDDDLTEGDVVFVSITTPRKEH